MLRALYDFVITGKLPCVITFIDYKAAFDSVSHKFLDSVLARAKVSRKCRAIFRAIYNVAKGMVRVNGILGKKIFSEYFKICRGVVQGDIVSPILFILALDQLIQLYDKTGKGVKCGQQLTYRVLGYADDAALAEAKIDDMTTRLTTLADKSLSEADMRIRMDKTFTQHVQIQDEVKVTKEEAMAAQRKFKVKCDFCDRRFKTEAAMQIHRAACAFNYNTTEKTWVVEGIVGVFGRIGARWFLVKWGGFEEPEWEREHLLLRDGCRDSIRAFWDKSGLSPCQEFYAVEANKCEVCGKEFKRAQDLKAHKTRQRHHVHQMAKVTGTAKKAAKRIKHEEAQALLPTAMWGEVPAENCWDFEYLGSMFTPDGSCMTDVRRRIAMAQQRHGKLRHIWKAKVIHLRLKMRLYVSAVVSILKYGSEAWLLTAEVQRAVNGANSKMVAAITGRPIRDEAKKDGKTYDAVAGIRATRLKWLGCILRMDEGRMVHRTAKRLYGKRRDGDILMDAPSTSSWEELVEKAKDEKGWRENVRRIKDTVEIKAKGGGKRGGKRKRTEKKGPKEDKKEAEKTATQETKKVSQKSKKGGEEKEGDDDDDDEWWAQKTKQLRRERKPLAKSIHCKDGFTMSVQASSEHFCSPRNNSGPYDGVEVTYPSEWEDLLLPFTDNNTDRTPVICATAPTLYVNVPPSTIRAVIKKHGGLTLDSGNLPPMVEVDERGFLWAAAAEVPSDLSADSTESEDVDPNMPTSVVQLGLPPPPPPAYPPPPTTTGPTRGEITPPQPLRELTVSPIATNYEIEKGS